VECGLFPLSFFLLFNFPTEICAGSFSLKTSAIALETLTRAEWSPVALELFYSRYKTYCPSKFQPDTPVCEYRLAANAVVASLYLSDSG